MRPLWIVSCCLFLAFCSLKIQLRRTDLRDTHAWKPVGIEHLSSGHEQWESFNQHLCAIQRWDTLRTFLSALMSREDNSTPCTLPCKLHVLHVFVRCLGEVYDKLSKISRNVYWIQCMFSTTFRTDAYFPLSAGSLCDHLRPTASQPRQKKPSCRT